MRDLEEFFDPTLRLPIRGKTYVVRSPSAAVGLRAQRLMATGVAAVNGVELSAEDVKGLELDDDQERELMPQVLGDVYDEMLADGLPWHWIRHAGTTAFMWIASGREAAERFWEEPPGEHEPPVPPAAESKPSKEPSSAPGGSTRRRTRRPAAETSPSPTSASDIGG